MSVIDPTMSPSDLRALAEQSNAWPFEEAKAIVARLKKKPEGRGAVRDRLRPVRPAAYRHVRRGRAHHDGAPRLPRADRGQDQDAAARLLRRHGRLAQGARQRAEQGHAGALSRQAADRACPTRSRTSIRASAHAQQCAAARASSITSASTTNSRARPTTTSRAASTRRCCRCSPPTTRSWTIMLPTLGAGAPRDLFAVPADLPTTGTCCRCR